MGEVMSLGDEFLNEQAIPVIFMDQDGVVTRINSAFTDTFLWTEKTLVGQPLVKIIPPSLQDAHNMGFTRYKINRQPTLLATPLDLQLQKGDGEVVTAKHFIVALEGCSPHHFAAKISLKKED
jgi:PAS domain S-box-containing protein